MKTGQSGVKSTDLNGLKEHLIAWIKRVYSATKDDNNFKDADLTEDKSTFGFQNEWTGLLLCPVTMDWGETKCVVSYVVYAPLTCFQDQGPIAVQLQLGRSRYMAPFPLPQG